MWLGLLSKFWLPLAVAAAIIGAGVYYGHTRYESGYAASEAKWQPLFAAAERAKKEADEKARQQEADSISLSQKAKAEHEKTVASLNLRAADAERRYADIMRKRPASSSCGAVPQDGGAARDVDAARTSDQRDERASRDFAALARRCEADAATLTDLQGWLREQLMIQRR